MIARLQQLGQPVLDEIDPLGPPCDDGWLGTSMHHITICCCFADAECSNNALHPRFAVAPGELVEHTRCQMGRG